MDTASSAMLSSENTARFMLQVSRPAHRRLSRMRVYLRLSYQAVKTSKADNEKPIVPCQVPSIGQKWYRFPY